MTKYILILLLASCSADPLEEKQVAITNTATNYKYIYTTCLNGVMYYNGQHRLAVAYNTDGTVKLCKDNK